jgi:PEP-CTERM motif
VVAGTLRDSAKAVAGTSIRYQVALTPLAAPAFTPPQVALRYSAAGEAHVSGADAWSFYIGATLGVGDFPYAQYQRQSVSGALSASFGGSSTLWVAPDMVAEAMVYAHCLITRAAPGSADCQANADPVISFDQAAFDARYGTESFDLASAWRLDFSQPVPEPGTLWLGLAGMALLGSLRARTRHRG